MLLPAKAQERHLIKVAKQHAIEEEEREKEMTCISRKAMLKLKISNLNLELLNKMECPSLKDRG